MSKYLFSLNLNLAFVLAFIFIFLIPIIFLFIKKKKIFIISYLIIYIFLLFLGVFSDIKMDYEIISFSILITSKWANNNICISYLNFVSILINLFLLFPIGYIYPSLNKSKVKFYKLVILGFSISFLIEFLQFLLPIIRYPEVLDIINNTISVILGYLYYLLITKLVNRGEQNDKLPKQKNSD